MTVIPTTWLLLAMCNLLGPLPTGSVSEPTLEPSYVRIGAVGHREERVVEFTVSNPGSTPLEFTSVKESCSCMKVSFDARPIPPGESRSGTVTVTFGRSFGDFHKQVDFRIRGRRAPLTLHLFAKLHPGVRCSSLETVLEGFVGSTAPESRAVIELTSVVPQLPAPTVTEIRFVQGGEHLRATLIGSEGNATRIEVSYAPTHPEGTVRGELNALIDGRLFVMPVRGHVYRGIRLDPPHCNFNVVREPKDLVETVHLIPAEGTSFKILSTKYEARARGLELAPEVEIAPREGGGYTLTLTIAPQGAMKGGFGGKLIVETDHPEKPRIEVPVLGHIP